MEPLFIDKTLLSGEINMQKLLLCVKVNPNLIMQGNPGMKKFSVISIAFYVQ